MAGDRVLGSMMLAPADLAEGNKACRIFCLGRVWPCKSSG